MDRQAEERFLIKRGTLIHGQSIHNSTIYQFAADASATYENSTLAYGVVLDASTHKNAIASRPYCWATRRAAWWTKCASSSSLQRQVFSRLPDHLCRQSFHATILALMIGSAISNADLEQRMIDIVSKEIEGQMGPRRFRCLAGDKRRTTKHSTYT